MGDLGGRKLGQSANGCFQGKAARAVIFAGPRVEASLLDSGRPDVRLFTS